METLLGRPLEVEVRDSVDKALKILKQKMSKEGILQEIKRRRYYEKPSVKRKRKMRKLNQIPAGAHTSMFINTWNNIFIDECCQ